VLPDVDKGDNAAANSHLPPLDPTTGSLGEAQFYRDVRDETPVVIAPRLSDVPGTASLPQRMSLLLYSLLPTGRLGTSTSVCLEHTKVLDALRT
jgi:hypothetical protein